MYRLARRVSQLLTDKRGGAVERWAITSGAIAVVSVVSAHGIDAAHKRGLLPEIVWRSRAGSTQLAREDFSRAPGGVDYTATATIAGPAAATRLDPCTGRQK